MFCRARFSFVVLVLYFCLFPQKVFGYAISGYQWANPNITVSYMPDGTDISGSPSVLFAELNHYPTATWQREFARALQTWAEVANINFRFVPDDGSPSATIGLMQGDSRFGDVRLGSRPTAGVANASFPGNGMGYTTAGDITMNSSLTFYIGITNPDIYSVLLHETGHSLGLYHSVSGTVMCGTLQGIYNGLTADDIAGIQAIYGSRQKDAYDSIAANDTLSSASSLALSSGSVSFNADLTTRDDVDYYKVTVPSGSDGTLLISVDARNYSLLTPKVQVYNSAQQLVAWASAITYGTDATVQLGGLVAGQVYTIVADGATNDVFGAGAYKFSAKFGGILQPPAAPSGLIATAFAYNQINLTWSDVSGETSYEVERSLDNVTWTLVGQLAAGATSFQNTSLNASTRYYYHIFAKNTAGRSPASLTVSATTPAAPTAPAAPSNLKAQAISTTSVALSWTDNSSNESGFYIERSADGISYAQVAQVLANTQQLTQTGLVKNKTYHYRIRSYNSSGASAYSLVAKVTTLRR